MKTKHTPGPWHVGVSPGQIKPLKLALDALFIAALAVAVFIAGVSWLSFVTYLRAFFANAMGVYL